MTADRVPFLFVKEADELSALVCILCDAVRACVRRVPLTEVFSGRRGRVDGFNGFM